MKENCVALHIIYNNENTVYTNTLYRLIKFTKAHTQWYHILKYVHTKSNKNLIKTYFKTW